MADRKEPPFYNDDSMGTFQYKLPFYESMELFIETLTGTCFQLRVSPFEAVVSVKAKIQRLEGIPVAQQHLIWNNLELDDDYCLHDYSIAEGCTLKLVLAMRGGPINTRRVTVEEPIKDVSELMEGTSSVREEGGGWERSLPSKQTTFREEGGWERTLPNNKQVTFLVYRDGDQLNFFRVVDRGDGTLTPLSQSLSGGSMYNVYPEEDDLVGGDSSAAAQHSLENNITMSKMKLLKAKMEDMNLNKKPKKSAKLKPRPPVSSQSHPCGGSLGPPPPTARHTHHHHHHHRLFRGAALPLVNQPRHSSSSTQLPPIRDHHHHHEPAVEPPPPSSSNLLSVSTRRAPPFSFSSASSSSSCYMLQEEEASWGEEGVCPPVARPPPKVSRLDGGMGGGATRLMRDCVYPQLPPLATRGQHEGGPFQFDVAAESRGEALALGAGLLEERPPSSTSSPSPSPHHHHGPPLFQDLPSSDPLNLDTFMQAEEEGVVGAPSLLGAPGTTGETPGAPAASLLSTCTLGGMIGPPPSSSPLPSFCASPCLPSRGLHHHHHHHHQQHFDFSPSPPAARPHVQAQQRPPTTLLSPGAVSPRPPAPTSSPPRPARLRCVKVESPGKRSEVICKSEARVITEMANQACKEPLGTLSNAQLLASLASARAAAAAGHGEEDFRLGLALPSARASGPGIPSREEDFRLGLALPGARASGPGIPSSSSSIRLQQEDLMITQMSPLHRGAAAAYNVASNSLGSAGGPNTSIRRLGTPTYHLPPVKAPMGAKKKSSKHCFLCGKKTGLATSYECRCSHNFCATHRYAETHDCTYDYKSAGRRFLQESNPIITTPKLPKI